MIGIKGQEATSRLMQFQVDGIRFTDDDNIQGSHFLKWHMSTSTSFSPSRKSCTKELQIGWLRYGPTCLLRRHYF